MNAPCLFETFIHTVSSSGRVLPSLSDEGAVFRRDLESAWDRYVEGNCNIDISVDGFRMTIEDMLHLEERFGFITNTAASIRERDGLTFDRIMCIISDVEYDHLSGFLFVVWDGGDNIFTLSPRHIPTSLDHNLQLWYVDVAPSSMFFSGVANPDEGKPRSAIQFFSKEESDIIKELIDDAIALSEL